MWGVSKCALTSPTISTKTKQRNHSRPLENVGPLHYRALHGGSWSSMEVSMEVRGGLHVAPWSFMEVSMEVRGGSMEVSMEVRGAP